MKAVSYTHLDVYKRQRYSLREAVLLNDVELARTRLDEGGDVDTGRGMYDGPLLKIAAELGYLDIVTLLLDRGANIEATDDLGRRALMSAACHGQTEIVRCLLDRGADINAVDWSGQSALSNATAEGHQDLFNLLRSRGARHGIIDALALNDIPLLEALLDEALRDERNVDLLSDGRARLAMFAVGYGNLAAVDALLARGASHWHPWFDQHSLLAEAAKHGHIDIARRLIEHGADLHTIGRDGLTPLEWATRASQEEVATLLKQAGAVR